MVVDEPLNSRICDGDSIRRISHAVSSSASKRGIYFASIAETIRKRIENTDLASLAAYWFVRRVWASRRDLMIPHLAKVLLARYLRYHDSAGRKSVWTSIDGKLVQMEAGTFFECLKIALAPLNRYLVDELHRKPISPARVARFALSNRRYNA
jgi:hypothetical protein